MKRIVTYEVWVSLLPDHMITSAGEVFVRKFLWYTSSPDVIFLNKPEAFEIIPLISFRAYEETMPSKP